MSNTALFGKVKDPELMIYSFRGQLQCRMGGKREGPIETLPKFWNLNPLTAWTRGLENSRMEEKLRVGEEGARVNIGE